jgi:hypothetical protein
MSEWKFVGHCFDGDRFEIDGVNVWSCGWRATGAKADITDPLYGAKYQFPIYEAGTPPKVIRFAASEFSNTVWGFYIEPQAHP